VIFLDTHVVAWLYEKELNRFPDTVLTYLDTEDLLASPLVLLELAYLHEIGRLLPTSGDVFAYLESAMGLTEDRSPFSAVSARARELTWTRDPFDRIIVAQADINSAPLVTKDQEILIHYENALWE
jgi:PIN domain nuclease of toxin-antitoxin system